MLRGRALSEARSAAIWLLSVTLLAFAVVFAGPSVLRANGVWVDGGEPTIDPSLYAPSPTPTPTPRAPTPAIAAATAPALPRGPGVAARLAAVPRTWTGNATWLVLDPDTGTTITESGGSTPMIPASTMKVLTSVAALSIVGPDTRFSTRVVSPAPGQIVLVGGGDPYLRGTGASTYPARASIVDLADATAAALTAAATSSVTLTYDDTLFTGRNWHPNWPAGYHEFATVTSALWLDEGIAAGVRSAQPALDATTTFANLLRARGVQVASVAAGKAPEGATEVAAVQSLPLDLIVQELLLHSDNDAAEVVARQAAIAAGRPGSFADAAAVVSERLQSLGLWRDGMVIDDGSGLSRFNRATAAALAAAVAMGVHDDRFRAVIGGLPVAAGDGTLRARFGDAALDADGRGVVRAKTGTLTGVHTLAGVARTQDGVLLAFAFVTNDVAPGSELPARAWLDHVTSAVAACGCG